VCPHGAMNHDQVPLTSSPEIQKGLQISTAQAVQFLRSRRSIRHYRDQAVETEKIQQLIELARYAPTGSNRQEVEWTVFTDKTVIRGLAELTVNWMRTILQKDPRPAMAPYMPLVVGAWDMGYDVVMRDAPALVIASVPRTNASGMVDLSIALSYLELMAPSLGLGTCWAGLLHAGLENWGPLQEAVSLPAGHTHQYPMMLGYPKMKYFRLPERKTPKIHWR
jgi:nitroreductase